MKLVNFYRKPISVFVMVAFTILLCFWANQIPAASAAEKSQAAALENSKGESGGFLEKVELKPTIKKEKKFPWLIVALVAVVGGAALYFLVLKKTKYELTITLGAGTTGTPTTNKYKKGEVVLYSFSAQSGYGNLQVMLDGALVASTGSVTMNKAHTITTSATYGATLQINSTPSGARIYLNNVDSGFVTPHTFSFTEAVTKAVRLTYSSCSYIDYKQTVSVNLGQTITINATLAAGIQEDFSVPASSCWLPLHSGSWSTSGGVYKYSRTGSVPSWSTNVYNHPFSGNYTVTVKLNRKLGSSSTYNGIFLGTSASSTNSSGYFFEINTRNGFYQIFQDNNRNWVNDTGDYHAIKDRTDSSAINKSLNTWNILKIVKVGTNYTFYINNVVMHSFTNSTYDPHYVFLISFQIDEPTQILYDYVTLTF